MMACEGFRYENCLLSTEKLYCKGPLQPGNGSSGTESYDDHALPLSLYKYGQSACQGGRMKDIIFSGQTSGKAWW